MTTRESHPGSDISEVSSREITQGTAFREGRPGSVTEFTFPGFYKGYLLSEISLMPPVLSSLTRATDITMAFRASTNLRGLLRRSSAENERYFSSDIPSLLRARVIVWLGGGLGVGLSLRKLQAPALASLSALLSS